MAKNRRRSRIAFGRRSGARHCAADAVPKSTACFGTLSGAGAGVALRAAASATDDAAHHHRMDRLLSPPPPQHFFLLSPPHGSFARGVVLLFGVAVRARGACLSRPPTTPSSAFEAAPHVRTAPGAPLRPAAEQVNGGRAPFATWAGEFSCFDLGSRRTRDRGTPCVDRGSIVRDMLCDVELW